MKFADFNLSEPVMRALQDLNFETPTDIQEQAIPVLLNHPGDFVGQAQTGTGKTGAFLIPLIEKLDPKDFSIQAMIIAPTRELANQLCEEIKKFTKYTRIKSLAVYGGASYTMQLRALKKDRPQIVVGTPGRTLDLIDRGALVLDNVKLAIIDEADEMLNMGFIDDIETILSKLDSQRKVWMFSATMPAPIMKIVKNMFKEPKTVKVAKKTLSNESIEQFYCLLDKRSFKEGLCRFLQTEKDPYAIIFCETREETKFMAEYLSDRNMPSVALHGDLTQKDRDFSMDKFRTKKATILVCTDVAARGIDIQDITHVINYGIPRNLDSYVHRIGRTGRASAKGVSITFVTHADRYKIRTIEGFTKGKLNPYVLPDISKVKQSRVEIQIEKMKKLKDMIIEKGDAFKVDKTFEVFEHFMKDLKKEDMMKFMFSWQFNAELKKIDQSGELSTGSAPRRDYNSGGGQSRRPQRGRGGYGRGDRNSGGRSYSRR